MKQFEKKIMRFVFNNRMKSDRIFYGVINSVDFFGNSYFFGRLADNFFNKEKFKEVKLENIIKDFMIEPSDDKLIKPRFTITKGEDKLVLINFRVSYDGDHATEEVSCNYDYYKLFEKDVAYIYNAKGMICLYDENKALIGVIAKVINRE